MKSEQVKFIESGYKKIYHKMHPISSSEKMALTKELVNFVCAAFTNFDKETFDYWVFRARELALRSTGIFLLLRKIRKSELLPNGKGSWSGL